MDDRQRSDAFDALGQSTRLRIFVLVAEAGVEGVMAGTIAQSLEVPPSHISKHLDILVRSGLLVRSQQGRVATFTVDIDTIGALARFLLDRSVRS